jgi:glycosyltransferase involved in cell wall biosynthesis
MRRNARRALRVLHIYRRFHPDYTGDGIYYMKLIPIIAGRGVASEVLVLETKPASGLASDVHDGLRIHYLSNETVNAGFRGTLAWVLRHIWRFDIVHVHSHTDRWFIAYILARLCGRRVIFSCSLNDSPTQLLASYQPRYRRIVAFLSRSINQFVVISPHLLRLSQQSTPGRRLRFIPQGVILNTASALPVDHVAARRAVGLDPDDFLLLNVGSIIRRKNVLFLVQALTEVPHPNVKLVVVGPALEDDYMQELADFIAEHGLGDRIIFTGFSDNPERYYAACDVFVFASLSEGFPNVFLEAMNWSLPIVTLFLPGLVDFIIDHGQTGFLASSLQEFADHIASLAGNRDRCLAMGKENNKFAERNFDMRLIASAYVELYQETPRTPSLPSPALFPDFHVRFSNFVASGPAAVDLDVIDTPRTWRPILQVVIDTESEFEWDRGTWTDHGQVASIGELRHRIEVFQKHCIAPALLIDYPIASHERSIRIIQALHREGCEIGVHPHTWSTPPTVEPRDDWHSFAGNLGPKLQLAKLSTLTRQIESILGERPIMFKAGRYGIGADTLHALEQLGFAIDLSVCPYYDFSKIDGPDFSRFTPQPGWFGHARRLLSLPTTAGWLGLLRSTAAPRVIGSPTGKALRLDRIATRLNLSYARRLSPEGNTFRQMQQLTRQLYDDGLRVFTLSLHSPTLQAGNTPYTRTPDDVAVLLRDVDRYLRYFREELGGEFSTPWTIYQRLAELTPPPEHRAPAREAAPAP